MMNPDETITVSKRQLEDLLDTAILKYYYSKDYSHISFENITEIRNHYMQSIELDLILRKVR